MNNLDFNFKTNKEYYFSYTDCTIYCNYNRYNPILCKKEPSIKKIAHIDRNGKVEFYQYSILVSETLTIKDFEDIQRASELVVKFNSKL